MMERPDDSAPISIREQAAEWFIRWHGGDLTIAERYEYLMWLKTSPVHIAETLRVCRMFAWMRSLELRPVANEDEFSNIVAMPARESADPRAAAPRRAASRARIAATVAAIGLAALVGFVVKGSWIDRTIVAEAGEWRTLSLADGSVVDVGPRTRLRSDFRDDRRVIHLEYGRALFKVAKDPSRPFVVQTEFAAVTATGTQFNVERRGNGVIVTVAEGSVAVAGRDPRAPIKSLAQGDQVAISKDGSATPIRQVNLERELAWVARKLDFDGVSVREAVADFNQLNRVQMIVDPTLLGVRVHGRFDADNPETFAELFARRMNAEGLDLHVVRDRPGLLRLEPRGQ